MCCDSSVPPEAARRPVSLVTGAGSGIGAEVAVLLAQRGHRLLLAGRTHAKLAQTQSRCEAHLPAGFVHLIVGDLAEPGFAARIVDEAVRDYGRIDNLVNCAGIAPLKPVHETSEELLAQTLENNALAPARLMLRVWPHLRAQGGGCIVNVSSLASSDPFPGFFAYGASKAALDSFTRSAHKEGAAHGIRAFCVNPGAVETPMLRSIFPTHTLPATHTLAPVDVAQVIVECIEGRREDSRGRTIPVTRQRGA